MAVAPRRTRPVHCAYEDSAPDHLPTSLHGSLSWMVTRQPASNKCGWFVAHIKSATGPSALTFSGPSAQADVVAQPSAAVSTAQRRFNRPAPLQPPGAASTARRRLAAVPEPVLYSD